jgi:hypothetical protein
MHSETKNYAQEIQCHTMPATMITTLPTLTLVLPSLSHHVNYARLPPLTLLAQALAQESKPTPGTRRAHDDRTRQSAHGDALDATEHLPAVVTLTSSCHLSFSYTITRTTATS